MDGLRALIRGLEKEEEEKYRRNVKEYQDEKAR
jgi:hypothetical protein